MLDSSWNNLPRYGQYWDLWANESFCTLHHPRKPKTESVYLLYQEWTLFRIQNCSESVYTFSNTQINVATRFLVNAVRYSLPTFLTMESIRYITGSFSDAGAWSNKKKLRSLVQQKHILRFLNKRDYQSQKYRPLFLVATINTKGFDLGFVCLYKNLIWKINTQFKG